MVAAGAGLALLTLTQALWLSGTTLPLIRTPPPFDTSKVQLDFTEILIGEQAREHEEGAPDKSLQASMEVSGLPKGYVALVRRAHPRLVAPNGQALPARDARMGGFPILGDVLDAALGLPVVNFPTMSSYNCGLFTLDAATYGQYRDTPLDLREELELVAASFEITAEMPLRKNARCDRGSEHLVVTEVLRDTDGVIVTLRDRQPRLWLTPGVLNEPQQFYDEGYRYFLLNRKRKEAIIQKPEPPPSPRVSSDLAVWRNEAVHLSFGSDPATSRVTPELTPEWLADAVLTRVELKPAGVFSRSLRVKDFLLNGRLPKENEWAGVGPDLRRLQAIELPAHPTHEQAKGYVRAIAVASQRQTVFRNEKDPQVALLTKIGPENVDVLIDEKVGGFIFRDYLDAALGRLAGAENKQLLIEALPRRPELARIVAGHGWAAEARALFIRGVTLHKHALPPAWIDAVAGFQDPATYRDLQWYFINTPNRSAIYSGLHKLGLDSDEVVALAWSKAKFKWWDSADLLEIAIQRGYPDSLETAIDLLRHGNDNARTRTACVLRACTPARGKDDEALASWVEANRKNLVFDPKAKKFVLREKSA